ncbi:uncharacterized protein EI97DRAFT_228595 [Westerdykella ornata]|uniref:Uncharacterized protein n=1 Tax=Westerdykella ornata TaxID=318751 RepID=A0A6A6JSR3_WESOR|nr:uncharacterized protein EI97DRAFT_228595 [Westerdykella ornata]KAF2279153.1 hypothetical protein EI97DRAFT_228595 [Westerdykella ornata]
MTDPTPPVWHTMTAPGIPRTRKHAKNHNARRSGVAGCTMVCIVCTSLPAATTVPLVFARLGREPLPTPGPGMLTGSSRLVVVASGKLACRRVAR